MIRGRPQMQIEVPPLQDASSMSIAEFLKKNQLLRQLDETNFRRLCGRAEEVHADAGYVFFREGDRADSVYVTQEGQIHLQYGGLAGRGVHTVCLIAPGEIFCCLPALDGRPYTVTAKAAVPSVVYRLSNTTFRKMLGQEPRFVTEALRLFCGRLRETGCQGCRRNGDLGSRLAEIILRMAKRFGPEIPLTRRELGELAGTTVETSIRLIKEFERSGWVKLHRGGLRVLDGRALKSHATGKAVRKNRRR